MITAGTSRSAISRSTESSSSGTAVTGGWVGGGWVGGEKRMVALMKGLFVVMGSSMRCLRVSRATARRSAASKSSDRAPGKARSTVRLIHTFRPIKRGIVESKFQMMISGTVKVSDLPAGPRGSRLHKLLRTADRDARCPGGHDNSIVCGHSTLSS